MHADRKDFYRDEQSRTDDGMLMEWSLNQSIECRMEPC